MMFPEIPSTEINHYFPYIAVLDHSSSEILWSKSINYRDNQGYAVSFSPNGVNVVLFVEGSPNLLAIFDSMSGKVNFMRKEPLTQAFSWSLSRQLLIDDH